MCLTSPAEMILLILSHPDVNKDDCHSCSWLFIPRMSPKQFAATIFILPYMKAFVFHGPYHQMADMRSLF